MIDPTLGDVPALLEFQLEDDLAASVAALRADPTAGPVALARGGVDVVRQFVAKDHYERPLRIALEIQGLARALLLARSDSMPLGNLASEVARPLPHFYGRGPDEGNRMRGDLRARADLWLNRLEAAADRLVDEAARLFPARGTVATLARVSTTILLAARKASAEGKRVRVLLWRAEGQDEKQFRDQLRAAGVSTSRASPADPSALAGAQLVLVSALAVERDAVVAPPCTRSLVGAASQVALPCYALAGPEKLVPGNYAFPARGAEGEFDRVPHAAWAGVVGADGLLPTEALEAAIALARMEPTLL